MTNQTTPVAPELDEQIENKSLGWYDKEHALADITHGEKLVEIDSLSIELKKLNGMSLGEAVETPRDDDAIHLRRVIFMLHYIQYEAPRFMDLFCKLAKSAKEGELLKAKYSQVEK